MEMTGVQKLARILKVLVSVTFICNIIALPLVPGMVYFGYGDNFTRFKAFWAYDCDDALWSFFRQLWSIWQVEYTTVLTVFLLFCGVCTAIILWQGRRVLTSILKEDTFTFANAGNLKRAAVCCFLVSSAALVRMTWGLIHYASPGPLFTYNALFIPVFLMGGLLCLVMSALFRQAAELKAENDLTI